MFIVGRELRQKEHTWIKALSDRVQKQEMRELLERVHSLKQKFDRELADSVLEVSIEANWEIVEELRGDETMCQALLEIMEPEINQMVKEATEKETKRLQEETERLQEETERLQEENRQEAKRLREEAQKEAMETAGKNVKIREIFC